MTAPDPNRSFTEAFDGAILKANSREKRDLL
jgi:hypothetical protein